MAEEKQIQIKASEKDLKGKYSNLMQVVHNKEEFILDFFLVTPPQGILSSRVIMSPGHAKRMAKVLEDNLKKYEENFGKIEQSQDQSGSMGFKVEKS